MVRGVQCALWALVAVAGAMARDGPGFGVEQFMLMPQRITFAPGATGTIKTELMLNITYDDNTGLDLTKTSVTFLLDAAGAPVQIKNKGPCHYKTGTSGPMQLPGYPGWTKKTNPKPVRAYVVQYCDFEWPANSKVGHYFLQEITVMDRTGANFVSPNSNILSSLNLWLKTAVCLPPYYTVTNITPDKAIRLSNMGWTPDRAVMDSGFVPKGQYPNQDTFTVNLTFGFKSGQPLNLAATVITFVEMRKGVASPKLIQAMGAKGDCMMMKNNTNVTEGNFWCALKFKNYTRPGGYTLSGIGLFDTQGNIWNPEKTSLLYAIDSDISENHMKAHVGHHIGSNFHTHFCHLPVIQVIDEHKNCSSAKMVQCLLNQNLCTQQSDPPCPPTPLCQFRYRMAECATRLGCFDALRVWCEKDMGFFASKGGCGLYTQYYCARNKFSDCQPDLYRTLCATPAELNKITSKDAKVACDAKTQFNLCANNVGCDALTRDVSDCVRNHDPVTPPPEMIDAQNFYEGSLDASRHSETEAYGQEIVPQSQGLSMVVVGAVVLVAAAVVAFMVNRRRNMQVAEVTPESERELL